MELYELVSKIESEEEPAYIPRPRAERKEVKVVHRTDVGRIIYENYGDTKASMVYSTATTLFQEMLSKGYTFSAFESKVVSMLRLARQTGKPAPYVIGALSRMIKEV